MDVFSIDALIQGASYVLALPYILYKKVLPDILLTNRVESFELYDRLRCSGYISAKDILFGNLFTCYAYCFIILSPLYTVKIILFLRNLISFQALIMSILMFFAIISFWLISFFSLSVIFKKKSFKFNSILYLYGFLLNSPFPLALTLYWHRGLQEPDLYISMFVFYISILSLYFQAFPPNYIMALEIPFYAIILVTFTIVTMLIILLDYFVFYKEFAAYKKHIETDLLLNAFDSPEKENNPKGFS